MQTLEGDGNRDLKGASEQRLVQLVLGGFEHVN